MNYVTEDEIKQLRIKTNQQSVKTTKDALEQEAKLRKDQGLELELPNDLDYLEWNDQLELIRFYEGKIVDYCRYFSFDKTVQSTSIVFFKRFFLHRSVMDYLPASILVTCLFLSTKVENVSVTLEEFLSKIPKSPPSNLMVELELEVSNAIDFEYLVHHPYWALHGFLLDLQTHISQLNSDASRQAELKRKLFQAYQASVDLVVGSYHTCDVCLMFPPSQIALAAFQEVAAKDASLSQTFVSFAADRFQNEPLEKIEWLQARLTAIRTALRKASTVAVDKKRAIEIAAKLQKTRNPMFDPESLVFKLNAKNQEEERLRKKKMKAEQEMKNRKNVF